MKEYLNKINNSIQKDDQGNEPPFKLIYWFFNLLNFIEIYVILFSISLQYQQLFINRIASFWQVFIRMVLALVLACFFNSAWIGEVMCLFYLEATTKWYENGIFATVQSIIFVYTVASIVWILRVY